jgi:hypothetical protein
LNSIGRTTHLSVLTVSRSMRMQCVQSGVQYGLYNSRSSRERSCDESTEGSWRLPRVRWGATEAPNNSSYLASVVYTSASCHPQQLASVCPTSAWKQTSKLASVCSTEAGFSMKRRNFLLLFIVMLVVRFLTASPATGVTSKVIRITDGETVKVRLNGIDAPERDQRKPLIGMRNSRL